MRVNQHASISTSKVLLVPYEAHHVLKYHAWMQDPDIQEATASEPLTLEEEYENQQSWRTARDKLTFILCVPLASTADRNAVLSVRATEADAHERMIGDINFFLYPHENEDGEDEKGWLTGEVDVMVAEKESRGRGVGNRSVCALLVYIQEHLEEILREHASGESAHREVKLKGLMVKIKEANVGSRALFSRLGFTQKGEVNYFGEVTMVMDWDSLQAREWWGAAVEDYLEIAYCAAKADAGNGST